MYFNKQIILVNNEASCYFIQFNDKFEYIYLYIYIKYQIYVQVDTIKYACSNRQNKKLCCVLPANDTTIFYNRGF